MLRVYQSDLATLQVLRRKLRKPNLPALIRYLREQEEKRLAETTKTTEAA
jgi:hypothetical protein